MSFCEGDVVKRRMSGVGILFYHFAVYIGSNDVVGLGKDGKIEKEWIGPDLASWSKVQSGNSRVSDYAKKKAAEKARYNYSLTSFNCEDFAAECLREGGLYKNWTGQGQLAAKNTMGTTHAVGGTAFAFAAAAASGPFAPIGFIIGGFLALNGARMVAKN